MEALDLPQKIKILKQAGLNLPVMRSSSMPYDPEKPSLFDKHIEREVISVNNVVNSLIGVINELAKELLIREGLITKDCWKLLHNAKKIVSESKSVI